MLFFRRSLLLVGLLLTLFVAGCGTASTTGSTGTNNTMSGKNNNNTNAGNGTMGNGQGNMDNGQMGMGNGTATTMATPTTGGMTNNPPAQPTQAGNMQGGNMNTMIGTTKVKINNNMVTVLTDAKGMILYYKNDDPLPNSSCTGDCAKDWPPVVAANAMTMINTSMALPHKLTIHMTGNGNQVLYHGHPLYGYKEDKTPGQFTGRGQDGVWYLVGIGL